MFSVQSSVFDTEPFCTCLRACAEDVVKKWGETLTHTQQTHPHRQVLIQPLIMIRRDGLGVKAVVQ